MSSSCILTSIVSDEKLVVYLEFSLFMMNHFSATAFKIFSLFLAVSILVMMSLGVD
jgi:hypothetical protein